MNATTEINTNHCLDCNVKLGQEENQSNNICSDCWERIEWMAD